METPKNTFVAIFRQALPAVTDAEKDERAKETPLWAARLNNAGHKLDPRILDPENAFRGDTTQGPVTALLFLEAQDLNEAASLLEAHPALKHRASVELRRWTAPVAVPAT
jgi:hypothetical protein